MKSVFVVTTGDYSDYSIRAIFEKKEHAELLASRLENSNGVLEWELNKLADTKPTWLVWYYKGKEPEASQNCFATHGKVQEYPSHEELEMQIGVRANDEAHALKVAHDIRAQYLDKKLNP